MVACSCSLTSSMICCRLIDIDCPAVFLHCLEPTKFRYTAGEAYRYRYSASTASTVLGVTSRSTNLTLSCDVIVHVITPCEHAITVSLGGAQWLEMPKRVTTRFSLTVVLL